MDVVGSYIAMGVGMVLPSISASISTLNLSPMMVLMTG
jgi:hypothetical protein